MAKKEIKNKKNEKRWFDNFLTRKITKVGGSSYAVTLPMNAVRAFGWQEGQNVKLTIDEKNKRIVIEDWKGES